MLVKNGTNRNDTDLIECRNILMQAITSLLKRRDKRHLAETSGKYSNINILFASIKVTSDQNYNYIFPRS